MRLEVSHFLPKYLRWSKKKLQDNNIIAIMKITIIIITIIMKTVIIIAVNINKSNSSNNK